MRKTISIMLSVALFFSLNSSAFAAENIKKTISQKSKFVIEMENVPLSEAVSDATFSLKDDSLYKNESILSDEYRDVHWNVWGEAGTNPATHLQYPIGYSEHVKNGVVLSTYHYTRTFLGSKYDPRGDSGRVWGKYTVKAVGTDCIYDVWALYVHRVYYGVTD